MKPDLGLERERLARGVTTVGVDEVGRGCLAGPVVTAAVVLPSLFFGPKAHEPDAWWRGITDSKLLSPRKRQELALKITDTCEVEVRWCLADEVDRLNILHASLKAMRDALRPFAGRAQSVLVDGHLDPYIAGREADRDEPARLGFIEVLPVIKGDQKSISIAAASIIAKTYRDDWMVQLHEQFPLYGFNVHKGYPTAFHKAQLREHGPCILHRRSFCLGEGTWKKQEPSKVKTPNP